MDFFTRDHLALMIPNNSRVDPWHSALIKILPKYQIDSKYRVAHFISQFAQESNDFCNTEQNLNYSRPALEKSFSRYFGPELRNAADYAYRPEKIANYVYMDDFRETKLGNIHPGDGWKFRGRGLRYLLGRNAYTEFGNTIGMTPCAAAQYLTTENGMVEAAAWLWKKQNANSAADTADVLTVTKLLIGSTMCVDTRKQRFGRAMQLWSTHNLNTEIGLSG